MYTFVSLIAVVCPVMLIGNGTVSVEDISFGEEATVICDPGYSINGSSNITVWCTDTGDWSQSLTECVGKLIYNISYIGSITSHAGT